MNRDPAILAISSEIGRGHPSYLDSVLTALSRRPGFSPDLLRSETLQDIVAGLSAAGWKTVRSLYRVGARGGLFTSTYNRARRNTNPAGLSLKLLGARLRQRCAGFKGVCLVEHPLVARILAPVCRVAYLHGEMAAPASSAVPEAWRILVPLEETAREMTRQGTPGSRLVVTGLVIEPGLVERGRATYDHRLARYESTDPLLVAFFTSGAYPRPHVEQLAAGVGSCVDAGHRVVVFAGTDRRESGRIRSRLPGSSRLQFIASRTRQEESDRTAELFPGFDAFVAAAHERTNWAVGLGLPMFAFDPDIGPFAPLNRALARELGVLRPIGGRSGAHSLGERLSRLRRAGELASIARNGFGGLSTDGAECIAAFLLEEATKEPG